VRRIVSAAQAVDAEGGWDGGLFRIVLTLAATGSRFSQIARCVVSDVQPAQRRLMVPTSRKGKSDNKAGRTPVPIGPDVLAALMPATAGRLGDGPLFLRPGWQALGVGKWEEAAPRPWRSSSEFNRPWQLIAQRAGLPDVTPYSLRHAAIIRSLSLGLPVQLVAKLFDTSAAMIQANYAASIIDALGELAERMTVPLAPVAPSPLRVTS
jgi:integrase